MLRRMAEVLLGSIKVRRTIPKWVGGGVVVANAKVGGLRYLFTKSSKLDPVLFNVIQATVKLNDVVWDIGGNVGLFAVAAAGLAGRDGSVYTVEADRDTFSLLLKTSKIQPDGHAPIKCLNVAVAKDCGVVNFNIARRSRSANFISGMGSTQAGGVMETRLVPSLNLDLLLQEFSKPDVVKIDVEGAELEVLQGGQEVLSTVRPILFIEVCSELARAVAELLREQHRYRLFDGATLRELGPSDAATWDTVGIPIEKTIPARLSDYAG